MHYYREPGFGLPLKGVAISGMYKLAVNYGEIASKKVPISPDHA